MNARYFITAGKRQKQASNKRERSFWQTIGKAIGRDTPLCHKEKIENALYKAPNSTIKKIGSELGENQSHSSAFQKGIRMKNMANQIRKRGYIW